MPLETFPPDFESLLVTHASLDIASTGHGLDDPLDVAPIAWVVGEEFSVVMRLRVKEVGHPRDKKWKGEDIRVVRDHTVDCIGIAIADDKVAKVVASTIDKAGKAVDKLKAEHAEREARELEEAAGIARLGEDDEWEGRTPEDPDEALDVDGEE